MRPTTLLDYLYRLRVRSNYEDCTMFIEGPEDPSESREVHRHIQRITSATLLVHELHIRQLIGRDRLARLVDGWLKDPVIDAPSIGLQSRRDILLS
jgi:hypothetical protein